MTTQIRTFLATGVLVVTTACAAPVGGTPTPNPAAMVDAVLDATLGARKVFDQERLTQGVTRVLTGTPPAGYGLTGVTDVACPKSQEVKAGTTFECYLKIDGHAVSSAVVVKDDTGLYEVNPPR